MVSNLSVLSASSASSAVRIIRSNLNAQRRGGGELGGSDGGEDGRQDGQDHPGEHAPAKRGQHLGDWQLGSGYRNLRDELRDAPLIVALDYGIKLNILRRLTSTRFRVKVLP